MTTGTPSPYDPRRQGGTGPGGADGRSPRPRRSRARSLLPLAVAAWAALEIWLLLLLADAAGGLTVLAVLVAGFLAGSAAVKRAGRRAWRNLADSVQQVHEQMRDPAAGPGVTPPARPRGGTGTAMLGGLLLMVPGLASDAVGLLCLFPPTAALLQRSASRLAGRGSFGKTFRQARTAQDQVRIHRPDGKVVQGEVVRDDDPPRH